jgi:hypothetical protein
VRRRMRLTALYDDIGEDCMFPSIAAAVSAFEGRSFEQSVSQPNPSL